MKKWIFSKKNNKKYKKQQLLKALKFSYINRKRKSRIGRFTPVWYVSNKKAGQRFNRLCRHIVFTNWLLKGQYLN